MLYETAIRIDGKIRRLYYDTISEWLWFADTGEPCLSVESRKRVTVRVPDQIVHYARVCDVTTHA